MPAAVEMWTPQAVAAVCSADVVIGYYYIDQIEDLHAPNKLLTGLDDVTSSAIAESTLDRVEGHQTSIG